MVGAYLHFPNTPSWRGTQLQKSTETILSLPFTYHKPSSIMNNFKTTLIPRNTM